MALLLSLGHAIRTAAAHTSSQPLQLPNIYIAHLRCQQLGLSGCTAAFRQHAMAAACSSTAPSALDITCSQAGFQRQISPAMAPEFGTLRPSCSITTAGIHSMSRDSSMASRGTEYRPSAHKNVILQLLQPAAVQGIRQLHVSTNACARSAACSPTEGLDRSRIAACASNVAVSARSARKFSTIPGEVAPPDDPFRLKLVRFMVIAMILSMAWRVVPLMGEHSVKHGVVLLDAQEVLFQRSGAKRVRLMASSTGNVSALLEAGAVPKLLSLLERTDDAGVKCIVLECFVELAKVPEGMRELQKSGVASAVSQVEQGEGCSEEQTAVVSNLLQILSK